MGTCEVKFPGDNTSTCSLEDGHIGYHCSAVRWGKERNRKFVMKRFQLVWNKLSKVMSVLDDIIEMPNVPPNLKLEAKSMQNKIREVKFPDFKYG